MPKPTTDQIETWVLEARKLLEGHTTDTLRIHWGTRYARVLMFEYYGPRVTWGFIDRENGDVLAPKTVEPNSRPAKHPRGNIFTDAPADCCEWTGPRYLR